MKTDKGKVLVLGSDSRSFLTVIRSLGRKGIKVHIGWYRSDSAARYSRYISKKHHISVFSPFDGHWKQDLINLIKHECFDLVIPCDDPSIIPLQIHSKSFEGLSSFYLLESSIYKIANDKEKTRALANRLKIPVPAQMEICSHCYSIEDIESKLGIPVVLKPVHSFTQDNLNKRHDVRKAFNRSELKMILEQMSDGPAILAQAHFVGSGCGVELIADRGVILSAFQHERVHEPLLGGGSSYRKSIELDPELYAAAEKLIHAISYTGVAMLEFKRNAQTGNWVFIEFNARFWGSLPLAVAAGMDFPWYLYELLVNGKQIRQSEYRKNLYCRNLTADLEWLRANLQADQSNTYLHTVPLKTVIREWGNLLVLKERNDTFQMDDPMPGLADLFYYIARKLKGLGIKMKTKILSFGPSKTFYRRVAVKKIQKTRIIHFVCTGNICRSPFAHYYAASILGDAYTVKSSGIEADAGRSCPQSASIAAANFGVNLATHTAVPFHEKNDDPDIYLVFDKWNQDLMAQNFPETKGRVFPLGLFHDDKGLLFIADPYSRSVSFFHQTYRQIADAVDRLQQALLETEQTVTKHRLGSSRN